MHYISIKDVIDEDFTNYKKPSMFIATSKCTFKCEKEDPNVCCHNSKIISQPIISVTIDSLINRYLNNQLTNAVVLGGLEPFDQLEEILLFIKAFRQHSLDDIVIYTGYTEDEIKSFKYENTNYLESILNANMTDNDDKPTIIIKYGRFKLQDSKFDDILGISLASNNQYAKLYK